MKKILILGGASVHIKLIRAAQKMGLYTIVTDNLRYEESPGKQIANEYWDIDVFDVSNIVERARKSKIDGVISGWLDPCQIPYQEICEKLKMPCYGTREQFYKMTNKHAFKKMCKECGVDTVLDYSIIDVENGIVDYPIFVKPVDSRGSRGQSICCNKKQTTIAIEKAKNESSNGEILIEKYMEGTDEIQITYFLIDGMPYLIRTADSYNGGKNYNLEKVVTCSISPSKYTDEYIATTHQNVVNMFSKLGFKNGPIFMQGFYDKGKFRFFDPGLRFPGVDYDIIYNEMYNENLMNMMIDFSINGKFEKKEIAGDMVHLFGKRAATLFPTITAGKIKNIIGIDAIKQLKGVFAISLRHDIGDIIDWTYNVNQRIAEINVYADTTDELKEKIKKIKNVLDVIDIDGKSMIYGLLNEEIII